MADPTAPGRLLAGRYELGNLLGRGGMASVFEGTDRVLDRPVAIKLLHARFAEDPRFLERFRREARMAATLAHPGVVGIFDAGTDDHSPYIVMELVEGRTLESLVAEQVLAPGRAAEIGAAVCEALQAAHEKGLVHRDIKPGNIMLTPDGAVKVMDFGIARAPAHDTLTQTATVLGTAAYLSPEQARGDRVDHRSDLYSLGCVLYAMLTGQPPFTGDNAVAVATRHIAEEAPPVSERRADVPPALGAAVTRALAKDPADRFPDAAAMGVALRDAARAEVTPTRPLPAAAHPAPSRRRPAGRRWLPLVLLALAFTAALVTALMLGGGDSPLPDAQGGGRERPAEEPAPAEEGESPSPTPPAEEGDALAAAFAGLAQVLGDGVAAGEVTGEAHQKIMDGAQKVLEELEKGETEKSLEELAKVREETEKLFDEGQITSEERLAAILAAIDELEAAIPSTDSGDSDPGDSDPGGGPPGGEPPGQEKKEDDD